MFVNNRIVGRLEKCDLFFPISSMVLSLLDQLQIFSQLYLIELIGLLARFGMLVFFTNLSLLKLLVKYLAVLLFSIIDSLEWSWMERVH